MKRAFVAAFGLLLCACNSGPTGSADTAIQQTMANYYACVGRVAMAPQCGQGPDVWAESNLVGCTSEFQSAVAIAWNSEASPEMKRAYPVILRSRAKAQMLDAHQRICGRR
jgi:hypothetical protein